MNRIVRARQRRPRAAGSSIQLFPFLTVLLCTMGALIVVLVLVARQARLQAAQSARAQGAERQAEIERERDMVRWRAEQLRTSAAATQQQLADARAQLGQIEDHARRLRDEAARVEAALRDLQDADHSAADQGALTAQLARLQSQLAAADEDLQKARRQAGEQKPSFAVVPYDGINPTHRRPIYIECCDDAVILQPEGVVLTAADFRGPMGAGNPLAATVRAEREYIVVHDAQSGEPYPLLLVRPNGIVAYYVARTALASWGSDFGYELIDEDWKIAYRPANEELQRVARDALVSARIEQQRLIAAAPREYADTERPVYRAAGGHGGIVRDDSAAGAGSGGGSSPYGSGRGGPPGSVDGRARSGGGFEATYARAAPSARQSYAGDEEEVDPAALQQLYGGLADDFSRQGGAAGSMPTTSQAAAPRGPGMAAAPGSLGAAGSPSAFNGNYAAAGSEAGTAAAGTQGFAVSGGTASPAAGGNAGSDGNAGTGGNSAAGGLTLNSSGQSLATIAPRFGADGQTPGGASGYGGTAAAAVASSAGGNPAYGAGTASAAGTASTSGSPPMSGASASGGGSPSASAMSPAMGGAPPSLNLTPSATAAASSSTAKTARSQPAQPVEPPRFGEWVDRPKEPEETGPPGRPLAETRGAEWGLPDAARGAVPINRPIRVECYGDRLVLRPDAANTDVRVIPLKGSTEEGVDDFVSVLWSRMERWGMAGRGMYWQPVLRVDVASDGERRFAELQTLLAGSGLTVERRTP